MQLKRYLVSGSSRDSQKDSIRIDFKFRFNTPKQVTAFLNLLMFRLNLLYFIQKDFLNATNFFNLSSHKNISKKSFASGKVSSERLTAHSKTNKLLAELVIDDFRLSHILIGYCLQHMLMHWNSARIFAQTEINFISFLYLYLNEHETGKNRTQHTPLFVYDPIFHSPLALVMFVIEIC